MTTAQMSPQQQEQRQKREEEQRRQLQQQYEAFQRRQQQQQQQHPGSQDSGAPTKASLKAWWNHFTFAQKIRKETEEKKGALLYSCLALDGAVVDARAGAGREWASMAGV